MLSNIALSTSSNPVKLAIESSALAPENESWIDYNKLLTKSVCNRRKVSSWVGSVHPSKLLRQWYFEKYLVLDSRSHRLKESTKRLRNAVMKWPLIILTEIILLLWIITIYYYNVPFNCCLECSTHKPFAIFGHSSGTLHRKGLDFERKTLN